MQCAANDVVPVVEKTRIQKHGKGKDSAMEDSYLTPLVQRLDLLVASVADLSTQWKKMIKTVRRTSAMAWRKMWHHPWGHSTDS